MSPVRLSSVPSLRCEVSDSSPFHRQPRHRQSQALQVTSQAVCLSEAPCRFEELIGLDRTNERKAAEQRKSHLNQSDYHSQAPCTLHANERNGRLRCPVSEQPVVYSSSWPRRAVLSSQPEFCRPEGTSATAETLTLNEPTSSKYPAITPVHGHLPHQYTGL